MNEREGAFAKTQDHFTLPWYFWKVPGASMLFLVFYFLLAAVLFFQGLHLHGEVSDPMGVLPEEVAQAPAPSGRWGSFLMSYGILAAAVGMAGIWWPFFEPLRPAVFGVGLAGLGAYTLWLLFLAPRVSFMGKPSKDEGHH